MLALQAASRLPSYTSRPGLVDVASQPVLTGSRSSDLPIASQPVITRWSRLPDGRFTGVLSDHTVWLHATSIGYLPGLSRMAFIESRSGRVYQLGVTREAAMLSVPRLSPRSPFARLAWPVLDEALNEDLLPTLFVAWGGAVLLLLTGVLSTHTPGQAYAWDPATLLLP